MRATERGFTLIEILSVLVILGVLAAVAVPKYYDLQREARIKAAAAVVAEAQARINLAFGEYILAGNPCKGLQHVYLMSDMDGEDAISIGDDDTPGKAGGWLFNWDGIKSQLPILEKGESGQVTSLTDSSMETVDTSDAGFYLRFPQCDQ